MQNLKNHCLIYFVRFNILQNVINVIVEIISVENLHLQHLQYYLQAIPWKHLFNSSKKWKLSIFI